VGGDVIDFLMRTDAKPFIEVVSYLAELTGVKLNGVHSASIQKYQTHLRHLEILEESVRFYEGSIQSNVVSHLLEERRFTEDTIRQFRIGFAAGGLRNHLVEVKEYSLEECIDAGVMRKKDNGIVEDHFRNRIIFPNVVKGRVVHITGRIWGKGEYKYLHIPGPITYLFNEDALYNDEVTIVEGPTDVIAAEQAGFHAVALLGSQNLKPSDLPKFSSCKRIYIALDGDRSGKQGTEKAVEILGERARIVRLPDGFDICNYLAEHSADEFKHLLDSAKTQVEVELDAIPESTNKFDLPEFVRPILQRLTTFSAPKAEAFLSGPLQARFGLNDADITAYRTVLNELKVHNAKGDVIGKSVDPDDLESGRFPEITRNNNLLPLTVMGLDELLGRDFAEKEMVSNGILSHERTLLLIGAPKTGKSMLALNLAIALASGTDWLGFEIPEPQNVMYLSAEGGPALLQERLKAMIPEVEIPSDKLSFWWPEKENLHIGAVETEDRLIEAIRSRKVSVVMFDPLIKFHTVDENSSKEMSAVLKSFQRIRLETNVAMVIVHHSRKSGMNTKRGSAQEARGSSVLHGEVDAVAVLERKANSDIRTLDFDLRHAAVPDTMVLTLDPDSLTFSTTERKASLKSPTKAKIMRALKEMGEATSPDLEAPTGLQDRTIRRHLEQLKKEGKAASRPGKRSSNIWRIVTDETMSSD
jgi:DNA primase catalytic core